MSFLVCNKLEYTKVNWDIGAQNTAYGKSSNVQEVFIK